MLVHIAVSNVKFTALKSLMGKEEQSTPKSQKVHKYMPSLTNHHNIKIRIIAIF
uniref:Uncharacterized protein n=1 Tax=Anguilla anguilla TaxID=7936 RepID=A0A0E9W7N1_ANGAN